MIQQEVQANLQAKLGKAYNLYRQPFRVADRFVPCFTVTHDKRKIEILTDPTAIFLAIVRFTHSGLPELCGSTEN